MRRSENGSSRFAITGLAMPVLGLTLLLVLPAAAPAHEVEVLRGSQACGALAGAALPDVVVLRGARVGGAYPGPEDVAPTPPPVRRREPPPPVVQVIVVPAVSVTAPAIVQAWPLRPAPRRVAPPVWRRVSRAEH